MTQKTIIFFTIALTILLQSAVKITASNTKTKQLSHSLKVPAIMISGGKASNPHSPSTPVRTPMLPEDVFTESLKMNLQKWHISAVDLQQSYRANVRGLPQVQCILECRINEGPFKGGHIIANRYQNQLIHCYLLDQKKQEVIRIPSYCFIVMEHYIQKNEAQQKQK